ncbi:DNA alkylation repair protein [Psychrosphaera sp. 1_MG-2023]|uniref:DNA alkylation repair protein n=1 Tax=Psychrosphaera sp. 1_MG-2023 TaxID=3062643 RepID=UPI0026E166C5|nr:DNA alkylation repair protein [Psychrosphaera sp. 1_MG-2023]MDO6718897.1 DNA alkylation repair protein [Psychrosphaera sp. 1_MG-2023]
MKNVFCRDKIRHCANLLALQIEGFDTDGFYQLASHNIDQHELKERGHQVFIALQQYLPENFEQAIAVLLATLQPVSDNQDLTDLTTDEHGVAGWMILPYSEYAGELGQANLPMALDALKQMTKRFTSEFGIRALFIAQPEKTLDVVRSWLVDPCHHVRRLATEGCRPLLPWAQQIPQFKANPTLIMFVLEELKDDESEYVRRSVANNLNDIAKHHPDLVADVVRQWSQNASKNRQRLIKHASRTLIKQGHIKTLETFGYRVPDDLVVELSIANDVVQLNERLEMHLQLTNKSDKALSVLLDFIIDHQKANGKLTPKVFKWKALELRAGESVKLNKAHHIKPINTRKYYKGEHQVAVQINGQIFAKTRFDLTI